MRRSKSMLAVALIGLALGTPMALKGWEGFVGILNFLQEESDRLLGGILVALSIAVLARQARGGTPSAARHSASEPPKGDPSESGAPPA